MEKTSLQEGLNEVTINHVTKMIERNQEKVNHTISRLICESEKAQDYIVEIGCNQRTEDEKSIIQFQGDNDLLMNMGGSDYRLHIHAIGQVAEKTGIPPKYLRELSLGQPWERKLAATILNNHTMWTNRNRVLIRTVGQEIRGVLSDSYKRLDSQMIVSAFINGAMEHKAVICDAYMSDTKIWIESIQPTPIIIPTINNGNVVLYVGARFSTSDYGDGAVDMRAFLLNGVCLNGMVRESMMKQVHLGARLPTNLRLSNRTYELESKATESAVTDITRQLYQFDNIEKIRNDVQAASALEVDFDQEVRRLVKTNKLLKGEGEEVQKLLMNNNPNDGLQGAATLWKLTQAITAYARDIDPTRSRNLHELSGDLMERS